jgi:Flp pilus assembly protein TadD
VNLAQALTIAGKTNEAKAPYRRALALKPDNPGVLNNLAFTMLETGENADEALELAQRGLRLAGDPKLKNSLSDTVGWAYLKKKMYDAALQTFQPLVKANPANATFHYHLGATFYEKGDKRQARIELESALAAKPEASDESKIRQLLTHL